MKRSISLKKTLLLSFIVILLAFMLTNTTVSNKFIHQNLESDAYKIVFNYTTLSQKALEDRLYYLINTFNALENSPQFLSFYKDLNEENWTKKMNSYIQLNDYVLNTYYENYEVLDSIYIAFNHHDIEIYQKHDLFQKVTFDYNQWYDKYSKNNKNQYQWAISYSNPVFSTEQIEETISLFKFIGDENSDVQGIIMFNIKKDLFEDILTKNSLYDAGYFFMLGNDRIINFNDGPSGYYLSDQAYRHIYKKDEGGFLISDKRNLSVVYTTLEPLQWKLCYVLPEKIITANYKQLMHFNYLTLFILLLVGILFIIMIIKYISTQISLLVNQAEMIGEGNFNIEPNKSYFYEVNILSERFFLMTQKIKNLLRDIETEKEREKELELAILQAQINPHFLYNTLYSIKQQCQLDGSTASAQLIQNLSDFYRISLSKGVEFITIEDELNHIKNYIAIEKSKCHQLIFVQYNFDPYIMDQMIVKLTLQPIIENAIEHGIKNSRERGKIEISCEPKENCIQIKVSDNGNGIQADTLNQIEEQLNKSFIKTEQPVHYGIANVHHRLKIYYGPDYGLSIDSTIGRGTTVSIRIPYSTFEEE